MNKTEQTLIFRQRFAAEHGMTLDDVQKLVRLGNKAGRYMTYYCNGDPWHKENHLINMGEPDNSSWKSENSKLWLAESGKVDKRILELVKPFGFSGLEYNGLAPTLIKDKRDVRMPF